MMYRFIKSFRASLAAGFRASLGLAVLLTMSQLAWAGNAKIKVIRPDGQQGAPGDAVTNADDRVVAFFSYEKLETTQLCGGKMGPSELTVTVYADGSYVGDETASRLKCAGGGLIRKASMSKHSGRLTPPALVQLWERLGEMMATEQSRDLAAVSGSKKQATKNLIDENAEYEAHFRRAPDLRGVQSVGVKYLPEIVQTGRAALSSVRFMQAFISEGKIAAGEEKNN